MGIVKNQSASATASNDNDNPLANMESLDSKLRRLMPEKERETITAAERNRRENFFGVPIFRQDSSGMINEKKTSTLQIIKGKLSKTMGKLKRKAKAKKVITDR